MAIIWLKGLVCWHGLATQTCKLLVRAGIANRNLLAQADATNMLVVAQAGIVNRELLARVGLASAPPSSMPRALFQAGCLSPSGSCRLNALPGTPGASYQIISLL